MPKFHERVEGNLRSAQQHLRTIRMEHPVGNGDWPPVVKSANRAALVLINAERLTEQWVPSIVDRHHASYGGLRKMGIM